jgi:ABC-type multidrug transport system fused ATPase/permease subunit
MIGLERCEQILKIPQENYNSNNSINNNNELDIDNNWGKNGEIEFIKYNASYRPNTPDVLKNINLKIKNEEKIGIIGRSGSGKSSLINALSRIIEPKSGKILINNYDIKNINLNFLRKKISILPQESFIIETNLRDNIDPLNENSDENVLKIINDLSLLKNLEKEKKLNFEIKENGNNLSTGEKKLISFARTIIKQNKIVIMDDVTSSLDDESKKIINENIDKYFKKCTLIMITNQLEMLKKCQRIIVIDNGKIIQDGNFEELIEDKNNLFSSLIMK